MRISGKELKELEKVRGLIVEIAWSYGLDPHVVGAVISRESGAGLMLGKWGNPPDTGDRGHGRGLMQADDRYWPGFLNLDGKGGEEDAWRWPAFNIAFGCWLIRNNLRVAAKRLQQLNPDNRLRAALAAYNCGFGRVMECVRRGQDVDARTTGRDYSADVIDRAFELLKCGWPGYPENFIEITNYEEDPETVKWIQETLNAVMGEALRIDGDYGPLTAMAVERFQRKAGLVVDGDVDLKTFAKLKERGKQCRKK